MNVETFRTKTFWVCLAGLCTAAGSYYAGEMTMANALQTGFTCLIGMFLRDGMGDK